MNMNEIITGTMLTKVCNIKPFKGATDSKQVTLAIKYDGLTIGDVFTKALRSDVISWQNGPGRKGYDGLIDKSTVTVSAKAPGAVTVDPETAMVAKLIAMTPEEQRAELDKLIKLVKAAKLPITIPKPLVFGVPEVDTPGFSIDDPKSTVTVKKVEPVVSETPIKVESV